VVNDHSFAHGTEDGRDDVGDDVRLGVPFGERKDAHENVANRQRRRLSPQGTREGNAKTVEEKEQGKFDYLLLGLRDHRTPFLSMVPSATSPVLLDRLLDSRACLRKILGHHDRMYFDVGVECEEPGLCYRRDLGGILHIEEDERRPLPLIIGEIDGLRL